MPESFLSESIARYMQEQRERLEREMETETLSRYEATISSQIETNNAPLTIQTLVDLERTAIEQNRSYARAYRIDPDLYTTKRKTKTPKKGSFSKFVQSHKELYGGK